LGSHDQPGFPGAPKYAKYAKNPDPFPRKRWGFAYFAYFAVPSRFCIGVVFEAPHFSRFLLTFTFFRRGFGQAEDVGSILLAQAQPAAENSLGIPQAWLRMAARRPFQQETGQNGSPPANYFKYSCYLT
jgi:hypothetical protein